MKHQALSFISMTLRAFPHMFLQVAQVSEAGTHEQTKFRVSSASFYICSRSVLLLLECLHTRKKSHGIFFFSLTQTVSTLSLCLKAQQEHFVSQT